jgi:hypothetical protein
VHPRLQEARFWPHFKDCIGAIDDPTLVDMVMLHKNIMAVCDFDMRFIFVIIGWPGSAHDTHILNDTLLTYAQKFPHPPHGNYLYVCYP